MIESLTGNTWKAGELIADGLSQHGWSITGLSKVRARTWRRSRTPTW